MSEEYESAKEAPAEIPILIPHDSLSSELMSAIIENFVLREGTDYGNVEASLDAKIEQVRRQIFKGDVVVMFEQSTETVSLTTKNEFYKRKAALEDHI